MLVFLYVAAMSPALGMHPGMAPHLQQLQAHFMRSAAAAAALLPHGHPLQPPPPPGPGPGQSQAQSQTTGQHPHVHAHGHTHGHSHSHAHVHAHGLPNHTQLYPVSPHGAHATHGAVPVPPKTEVTTFIPFLLFLPNGTMHPLIKMRIAAVLLYPSYFTHAPSNNIQKQYCDARILPER